jgi:tetratricopeptide (TPR) repeat protein
VWWTVSVAAALLIGCRSFESSREPGSGVVGEGVAAVVEPPEGLEASAVRPRQGDDLARARKSVAEVVAEVPRPEFLAKVVQASHDPSLEDDREPPVPAQRAYLAGRQAWRENRHHEALRQLEEAFRLAPREGRIARLLGMIYANAGDLNRGVYYLEQAVQADPRDLYSLYLLGRFASMQARWREAIAILGVTAQVYPSDPEVDPSLSVLMRYYLGTALMIAGYDTAGIDQLESYLSASIEFDRYSRASRELAVLEGQRSLVLQMLGDAYSRLDRPGEAVAFYERGAKLGRGDQGALLRRRVYALMRVGEVSAASAAVVERLREKGPDPAVLNLVRYLADHGAPRGELVGALRESYDGGHPTPSLAMTIADLLGTREADRFLWAHLDAHPADQAVFARLLKLRLSDPDRGGPRAREAIRLTASLIGRVPRAADEYAAGLMSTWGDAAGLYGAIQRLPAEERAGAVMRLLAGKALRRAGRREEAVAEFEGAIASDPSLIEARVELGHLLLDAGEVDRAAEVIGPLGDSADRRVVKLRVRVLREAGRINEAIGMVERLLASRPLDVDLIRTQAELYLEKGDTASAERVLLEGLDVQPRAEELYEALLRLYDPSRSGHLVVSDERYRRLLQRLIDNIPQSRLARLERSKWLLASGQMEQAEPVLRQLLMEDARDPEGLQLLSELLLRTDRREEAERLLIARLQEEPNDPRLMAVALRFYRLAGDKARTGEVAQGLLRSLLADKPRDLATLDTLLEILFQSGAAEQAGSILVERLAGEPEDRGLLMLARRHYERSGDRERSFEVTERLLMLAPASPERARSLAALYLEYERPLQAVQVLEAAMEDPGDQPRALVNLLGRAWTEAGDPDRADREYERALERFPSLTADLLFDWAMLCERRGEHERSERLLERVLEIDPRHANANNALGYAWLNGGRDPERALGMIRIAVESEVENAAFLDSMGWAYYKLGRFEEAVFWLRRARAARGGEYPVILSHLGDALYRSGDPGAAAAVWQAGLAVLPEAEEDQDPELPGLGEKLRRKIEAVKAGEVPELPATREPASPVPAVPPRDRVPGELPGELPGEPAAPSDEPERERDILL